MSSGEIIVSWSVGFDEHSALNKTPFVDSATRDKPKPGDLRCVHANFTSVNMNKGYLCRHHITKKLRVKICAWIKVGAESKDFINWWKKHDWRILAVWRWCYTGRSLMQQRRKNLKPVQSCATRCGYVTRIDVLYNNIASKIVPCNITLTLQSPISVLAA